MALTLVDLGNLVNDGSGDDLRTAFQKVNDNFIDVEARLPDAITGENLGTSGASIFVDAVDGALTFRKLDVGANLSVSSNDTTVTVSFDTASNLDLTADITANNISATAFSGPLTGAVTGNLTGNVTGDLVGNVTGNVTGDLTGNVVGNVTGNVTGNLEGYVTGDLKGSVFADDSTVLVDGANSVLRGTHYGDTFGNVEGIVLGFAGSNITGSFTGTLTGQVSDISNHTLSELSDVNAPLPLVGQALVWSGTNWEPGAGGGGAGINIDGGSARTIFNTTSIIIDGGGA